MEKEKQSIEIKLPICVLSESSDKLFGFHIHSASHSYLISFTSSLIQQRWTKPATITQASDVDEYLTEPTAKAQLKWAAITS